MFGFYAHLSQINNFESDEAWIEAGTPLGKTGCSGNAHIMPTVELGSHLHFEVWYLKDHGKVINHYQQRIKMVEDWWVVLIHTLA